MQAQPQTTLKESWAMRLEEAQAAAPDIRLDPAVWRAFLAERVGDAVTLGALDDLDLGGLYIACGCLEGDPAALRAFDRLLRGTPAAVLRRMRLDEAAVAEILQLVRDRLLVGGTASARLRKFSGRGSLASWVRTVTVRVAADWRREVRPEEDSVDRLTELAATSNPELAAIRADQRAHFHAAFRATIEALTPRQRALLRLALVDGLSIDRIAPMYGASRASVARWIADAKRCLAAGARRALSIRLGLREAELSGILASLMSYADVSLTQALEPLGEAPPSPANS